MSHRVSGVCCIIKTCRASKRKIPNIRFFRFPIKNKAQRLKWLQACKIDENTFLEKKSVLICDRHFTPDQLGRVFKKKNAVPQLHLDTTPPEASISKTNVDTNEILSTDKSLKENAVPEIHLDTLPPEASLSKTNVDTTETISTGKTKEPIITQSVKKEFRKSGRRCIIKSCDATYRSNPKLTFFSFPDPVSERFRKWVEICKLTPEDLNLKNILICEKHFWKAELSGKHLAANAEPKFFLSAPRFKIIGPTDPKFIVTKDQNVVISSLSNNKHIVPTGCNVLYKCIIQTCGICFNDVGEMVIFPQEAINLFDVWSDIFKLDPAEIFNVDIKRIKENNNDLYICKKHFLPENFIGLPIDKIFGNMKSNFLQHDNNLTFNEISNSIKCKCGELFVKPNQNLDYLKTIEELHEKISNIQKDAEKKELEYLSIISHLREENLKLKEFNRLN